MNEYNSEFMKTQEQLQKVKNTEKENEREKASPYYKNRTTVAMKKAHEHYSMI
ncbi:MAG: hypothetical protein E7K44_11665 [Staphylococcus lugdunensis]|nr:hypothetical protein [Staphylococcus lugdunensis]